MSNYRFSRQVRYLPADLGLSGVTLAAERTSNAISLKGVNHLSIFVNLTAQAGVTRIDVNLDVAPLEVGETPTYYKTQTSSIAAGAATLSELDMQKAVSAATAYEIRIGDLNAYSGKIRISAGAGPGVAGDVVSVTVIATYGDI